MTKTKSVSPFSTEGVRFPTLLAYNTNTGHITISIPRVYKKVQVSSSKKWREANSEKVKAQGKAYYESNPEIFRAKRKAYYEANSEKAKAQGKAYREANPEKVKAYYEANSEKVKAQGKAYREANPEKVRAWGEVYRREHPREKRTYLLSPSDPDCTVLNAWFIGSEGHHVAWDTVVYVPAGLHRSVRHSLNQDKNMEAINRIAFDWLNGVRSESPQTTLEAFG